MQRCKRGGDTVTPSRGAPFIYLPNLLCMLYSARLKASVASSNGSIAEKAELGLLDEIDVILELHAACLALPPSGSIRCPSRLLLLRRRWRRRRRRRRHLCRHHRLGHLWRRLVLRWAVRRGRIRRRQRPARQFPGDAHPLHRGRHCRRARRRNRRACCRGWSPGAAHRLHSGRHCRRARRRNRRACCRGSSAVCS